MKDTSQQLDILIDENPGELPTVAISGHDFCLQWHDLIPGSLAAMHGLFTDPDGQAREVTVGYIFNAVVSFSCREGVFSFKLTPLKGGSDLVRIDLSEDVVGQLRDGLADVIPDWDT